MAAKVSMRVGPFTERLVEQIPQVKAQSISAAVDVRFVPINSVNYWLQNPWTHDDAVPRLAKYIAIHGQVSPVIVWRKNNTIYKGNHTKKALIYLGANLTKIAKEISTSNHVRTADDILTLVNPGFIKAEFRDFPSETAANAYGISDNNSSLGGEYDDAVLQQLLLTDEEYLNTAHTGFTEKELKQFKLSAAENMEKLANIDLQGETAEMGEFLILKFENAAILQQFKEATGMGKNERAIEYSKLVELF